MLMAAAKKDEEDLAAKKFLNDAENLDFQEFDDQLRVTGYRASTGKILVTWIGTCLTLGLVRVVFYWKPTWHLLATHVMCPRRDATRVLIKDQYGRTSVERIKIMKLHANTVGGDTKKCQTTLRYFCNKKLKYVWNCEQERFQKQRGLEGEVFCSYFHQAQGLSTEEHQRKLLQFGVNKIVVRVTPVVKLLFTQALNPFYVFQLFSIILWYSDQYEYYASVLLFISTVSLSVQIYQTRAMQRALKCTIDESASVTALRNGNEIEVPSEDLVPGDVILIDRHDYSMQCDAVVVSGTCVVNESMLTGESVPVTKTSLPKPGASEMDSVFSVKEFSRHVLFCGTKVIQTRTYGKDKARAVVLRTGFTTAKGELVRSILFPKPTEFRFSQDAFKFIGVLFLLSLIGIVYTFVTMISDGFPLFRVMVRGLDLITIVVPPALPAAMTVGIVFAQNRLKKSNIFCISTNSINPCGALNVVCFDKTGTLTEDGLDLCGVIPCYGANLEQIQCEVSSFGKQNVILAMATCHSLALIDGELTGDPLDLKMFEATKWREDYELGILKQFVFSSKLQRMSVIVKQYGQDTFQLYAKGSPEIITSLCQKETIPKDIHEVLVQYTQQGYRVIALAYKDYHGISTVEALKLERSKAEKDLLFLGLLVMENKIKPETSPTMTELKLANIRPVMITGDNMLTGLNVARHCGMVEGQDEVILVHVTPPEASSLDKKASLEYKIIGADEKHKQSWWFTESRSHITVEESTTFHLAMTGTSWSLLRQYFPDEVRKVAVKGTIFARMTPEQKQQLVEAIQDVGYYVGMCGDGANDCGALKTAHAGISLSETEASVASPFTSKLPNISCVPTVIKEGRAALVTSFGMFKYMACYSLTSFSTVCLLYWFGANLTGFAFLYVDLFLITTLSVTFGYTKAHHELSPKVPQISLLSLVPIFSIVVQIAVNFLVQLFVWFSVQQQPWFVEYKPDPTNYHAYQTHVVTTVFYVSVFQYITLAVVFSKGPPFRRPFYSNYLFLANVLLCTSISILLCVVKLPSDTPFLELEPPPSVGYRLLIIGIATINFLLCYILEAFVVNSDFVSSLQERFRPTENLPMHMKIKEQLAADPSWPPINANRNTSYAELLRQESFLYHTIHGAPKPGVTKTKCGMICDTDTETHDGTRVGLGVDSDWLSDTAIHVTERHRHKHAAMAIDNGDMNQPGS